MQLSYLYYLELSVTVFQDYRITGFASFWLSPLKQQKVENKQQKQQQKKKLQKSRQLNH